MLVEWSLHAQRAALRVIDARAFCAPPPPPPHTAAAAAADDAHAMRLSSAASSSDAPQAPPPQRHELALQPSGRWALLSSRGGGACAIDLHASASASQSARVVPIIRALRGHTGAVTCVDWHPAARGVCLTGGADGTVRTSTLAEENDEDDAHARDEDDEKCDDVDEEEDVGDAGDEGVWAAGA